MTIFHRGMRLIEYPTRLPSAGWYDDPYGQPQERWWDGQGWTDHVSSPAVVPEHSAAVAPLETASPSYVYSSDLRAAQALVSPDQVAIGSYSTDRLRATGELVGSSSPEPEYRPFLGFAEPSSADRISNPYAPARYTVADSSNPSATTGLVLGIVSLFFNLLLIPAILGIRSSVIGLKRADFLQLSGHEPVGQLKAKWGIALSIIGLALTVISIAAGFIVANSIMNAPKLFSAPALEQTLVKSVHDLKGITLTSVDCPAPLPATQGSSFECVATKDDGLKDILNVRVIDATGGVTWTLGV